VLATLFKEVDLLAGNLNRLEQPLGHRLGRTSNSHDTAVVIPIAGAVEDHDARRLDSLHNGIHHLWTTPFRKIWYSFNDLHVSIYEL